MNITKQEAADSLREIDQTMEQTRRAIANGCASPMLMLWGAIWLIGYAGTQFFPRYSGPLWAVLILMGSLGSWYVGTRYQPLKEAMDWRFGVFWIALFAYAAIWGFLLAPRNPDRIGAYMATIPMFAYVIGGLWLGKFFTWLGIFVTAMVLVGVMVLPGWVNLWIGIMGGGSLAVSGLYIRINWR